jgi:hypothetical protein
MFKHAKKILFATDYSESTPNTLTYAADTDDEQVTILARSIVDMGDKLCGSSAERPAEQATGVRGSKPVAIYRRIVAHAKK